MFLVAIGVGFLSEYGTFEHWLLRVPIVVIGPSSVLFGIFVLVGRRGKSQPKTDQ